MKNINVVKSLLAALVGLMLCTGNTDAQAPTAPFDIVLEPMSIPMLGGLQSYAFAEYEGKWLLIGGRLDGLHRRQPFAAFDIAGHNTQLIVVAPQTAQVWTASLNALPAPIAEQLSATNMEFYQQGDYLYIIGGYGYSATAADHVTYPNLTAVNVPAVINAILNDTPLSPHFRQLNDPLFQVTGGHLKKINDTYYLLGGQLFMGRYNPMGPNHGPGFVQQYTNAIRRFTLTDDGTTLNIQHLSPWIDSVHLHRRDYNAEVQILPSGEEAITMFSGVFQYTQDIPFLDAVNVTANNYSVQPNFQQYYNHYHCPVVPLYDAAANEMHTVFFGGIAQYYDNGGVLVQDNNVPFVKTIGRVTRSADGNMAEYKLPIEMPTLLGAGGEFMPLSTLPHFPNGVLKLGELPLHDTTHVGYIFGGISSTAANIFFTNDGTQSSASPQLFKVNVVRHNSVGTHQLNEQSIGTLRMQVYPNPTDAAFTIQFTTIQPQAVRLQVHDIAGKLLYEKAWDILAAGEHTLQPDIQLSATTQQTFVVSISTPSERATQKILLTP